MIVVNHKSFTRLIQLLLMIAVSAGFTFSVNAKISPQQSYSVRPLEQQREMYIQAVRAFNKRNYTKYRALKKQLISYPLYPYLELKKLTKNISSADLAELEFFLQNYQNSPVSDRLRNKVLRHYAKKNRWRDFLRFYKPQASAYLECVYLTALYKEGFKEAAYKNVPRLWLVGKSQHKKCDFIFDRFQKDGLLTEALIWQRIELAMKNNKPQLARYLSKRLAASEKDWVSLWAKLRYRPTRLLTNQKILQSHAKRNVIVMHTIKRLARKLPYKAIELLHHIDKKFEISENQRHEIVKSIGLSLARKHKPDAAQWLNQVPDNRTTVSVISWKIQHGIRQANWAKVISNIENLPVKHRQAIRWQFWWAYAHKELGNEIESHETLNLLASKRDYYGFLAADLLDRPYQFENSPIDVEPILYKQISESDNIKRAKEFFYLNQLVNARREWNSAIAKYNDEQLLTVAKIVYEWGWYDRAIAAIGKTSNLNDIEIRFPLAYKDLIENYSHLSQIDTSLIYAIIRRESIFITDARSHKGALGLMQIMPTTARATARATKTRYRGKKQLIKKKSNIHLGTQYLKQLLGRHNQQTVLATAAYNAGPRNVKKWLPPDEPMEAIRWIESIPYKETREYVTNVLAYKIIYQYRMGEQNKDVLENLMTPVPARI